MAENVTKSDVLDAFNFFKSVVTDNIYASTDTATTTSNGLMSAADKSKLDGIATDTYATKTELASKLDSDATLDFATKDDLTDYVQKVSGKNLSTNDFTDAYKSKLDGVDTDSYVMKVAGKDLSSNDFTDAYKSKLDGVATDTYATKTDLTNYVAKDGNKVLSTNDFTTAEKNKLTNIADSAQVNVIESVKVNNTALAISNKAVNIDLANASVKSAASLNSAKSLKVSLASSNAQSFDGSDNATVIGVGGILPVANGGTGNANGTVSGAAQLNTSRNFITNLASTVAGSFNGTASVSAGVTGTLPVANGGTGQTSLDNVTVGGANRDGTGNVITDTYITKTDAAKIYLSQAAFRSLYNPIRLGYRIKQSEPDPYERVEYLYDAVGMTPAKMDFTNNTFDYGSWQDVWFVRDNKPLMLKYDGTVDYYLNPNNYALKLDGTASDVASTSYGGNAMAQIPLCWVKRYTEGDYVYEIVSNVQYDSTYKAYAHTDAAGAIKDYFYWGLFRAVPISSKLRSLSNQKRAVNSTFTNAVTCAYNNGANWYVAPHSQYELLRTLLTLISKSTDSQSTFGHGYFHGNYSLPNTGNLQTAGQFWGSNATKQTLKLFHIEDFWGCKTNRFLGGLSFGGKTYFKMTPEGDGYKVDTTDGYTQVDWFNPESDYITAMTCDDFGMRPAATSGGSSSTYYCDSAAKPSDYSDDVYRFIKHSNYYSSNYRSYIDGLFLYGLTDNVNTSEISHFLSYV